jgi:subtilase family serine protease
MIRRNTFSISFASLVVLVLFAVSSAAAASAFASTAAHNSSVVATPASSASEEVVPSSLIIAKLAEQPTCSPSSLCPSMMDKAYGFDTMQSEGVNGTGQTILIDDACGDPNMASDLKAFDSQFNLPNPTLNIIYPEGQKNLCVDGGWSTETSLDVEWSHVVAPGATIDLLVSNQPDTKDMYGSWTYALNHNLGNQISNSYAGAGCGTIGCNNTIGQGIGPCDLTNGTEGVNVAAILDLAASKGVTVMGSAGDSGYWGLGTPNEEPIPADCRGVLTVGGTTLTVSSSGSYVSEAAWGGTGGGYVSMPGEPKYQRNAAITDPYHALGKPDVAADADPNTGVWFYNSGWGVVGGTSLSSPLWTGFMADVNQIRANNNLSPAGFINSFLYNKVYGKDGGSSLYGKDFHDITTGNNGWPAGTGWDPDTGLGSMIGPALAKTLGTNPQA